jgi:hypothetical protein
MNEDQGRNASDVKQKIEKDHVKSSRTIVKTGWPRSFNILT